MASVGLSIRQERKPSAPVASRLGMVWAAGRWFAFIATLALLVGMFVWPDLSLTILWSLLIPLLPASFFITPQWWRGICPLATTNQWFGGRWRSMHLEGRWLTAANTLGIVVLAIMVATRRLVFNENGPVLAITILVVIVAAAALGSLFAVRGGFCNAICPVLPVERLYGHHPLVRLDNFRCHPCTHCTSKGCLEVDQARSILYAIRIPDHRRDWLTTAYGIFAASLPGFIVGYFVMKDISWSAPDAWREAGMIYVWIAACSLASYLIAQMIIRVGRIGEGVSLALLAALSGILYYWFTVPLVIQKWQLPAQIDWPLRGGLFLLIGFWLARALQQLRRHAAVPVRRNAASYSQ